MLLNHSEKDHTEGFFKVSMLKFSILSDNATYKINI